MCSVSFLSILGKEGLGTRVSSPYLPLNAALPLATRAVMVMGVACPVLRENFVQYFPKQAVGWNSIKQAWEFLG